VEWKEREGRGKDFAVLAGARGDAGEADGGGGGGGSSGRGEMRCGVSFVFSFFPTWGWGRRLHGVLSGVLTGEPSPPSRILSDMELLERSVIGKVVKNRLFGFSFNLFWS
jgi:hypothetical protein